MAVDAIQLGVVASALSDDSRRAARASREMGFGGLLFDAFSSNLDLTHLSSSGRREFARLLTSQDQQLVGLRADLGAKGFGPGADIDRLLSRIDRVMEAAAGLAAPLICLDLGPLPPAPAQERAKPKITPEQAGIILIPTASPPPPTSAPVPPPDPVFVAQVAAAMADLGARADRYSVIFAFRADLASFASLEDALRRAACPWFGIDLDPVAVLRDDWSLDEVFSRLGPLMRHVRGRDAIAGPDRRAKAVPLGQGSTDWAALLRRLDESAYRGWITVDPVDLADRPAAAAGAVKHLKTLGWSGE